MDVEIKKNHDYTGEECPKHLMRDKDAFLEEMGLLYDDLYILGSVGSYTINFLKKVEKGE